MRKLTLLIGALVALATGGVARANTVTDWNRTMIDAVEAAKTPPPPAARLAAIVQASVFDAVNGIRPRYAPYRVAPGAPGCASRAAAAAGAAYEALIKLVPNQKPLLDERLASSLAEIHRSPAAVAAGLKWGTSVAEAIVAWRSTDGFDAILPPYQPGSAPGDWQPTPPAFAAPAFRQFATMVPFALASPAQFDPGSPPSLSSRRYARDFNEVKTAGSATSTVRSPLDSETAVFWQADTPAAMWDRVADALADATHARLLTSARRLALANIAMADATIAVWNAKNRYERWRPVTAIRAGDTDGNPDTAPDSDWTPLLVTPAFQEYPAGHPGVSAAAAGVLTAAYGNRTSFTVTSAGAPGVERHFDRFSTAVRQVEDARVFGGIHFRFATTAGARMGDEVAGYVLTTLMDRR
jgi:PAP2 superfamily